MTGAGEILARIDAAARDALTFAPEERRRLIEPYMGFLKGVADLRDDQVLHLITLHEYHATLADLATAQAQLAARDAERLREIVDAIAATDQPEFRSHEGEYGEHDILWCRFCDQERGGHRDDCLWLLANAALAPARDDVTGDAPA